MKDDEGHVTIKGFYDGVEPLHPEEQAMLDAVPDEPANLMKLFGIAAPERAGLTLQQALQLPTLNIRGLASAYTGPDARTIIPDIATASLDVRLVKETPAREMTEKILDHIRGQAFVVTESDPSDPLRAKYSRIVKVVKSGGSNAYRTSPLLSESRQVSAALERMFGERPVQSERAVRRCRRPAPDPGSRVPRDLVTNRQLRQQPALGEREPAAGTFLQRHSVHRRVLAA